MAKGENKEKAIFSVLKKELEASRAVHFDGNGYSDEWKQEAARRWLDCETAIPLVYDAYLSPGSIQMFAETHVFTEIELHARNEVKWEIYTKKIQIEGRVLGDLALNHIVPIATRYQSLLADNVLKIKALFPGEKGENLVASDMKTIENIARHLRVIKDKVGLMVNARKVANKLTSEREKAIVYHATVAPLTDEIRYHIDKLELMVDNNMWPLPKYGELLFIR